MGRTSLHPFAMRRPNSPSRRRADTPSSSSRSAAGSRIDERLIEGARTSRFFSRRDIPESDVPFAPEPDLQLDAFDLELLAQSERPEDNRNVLSYGTLSRSIPQDPRGFYASGINETPPTSPVYKSPLDLQSSSSPLARFQAVRNAPLRRHRVEKQRLPETPTDQVPESEKPSLSGSEESKRPYQHCPTPFQNIPMSIRGIVLVSTHELPDNYRSLFHFPVFNAVQSKCFQAIYKSDDNVVLAAPTGSGKTAIMELAICRLLHHLKDERFKVIYQAPTKSLCSERFRDWNGKFSTLGLRCAELTGDTDQSQLRSVQNSQIIITTPEKWDSMTRKWKDHARLMQLVRLFLIDEVHILKEARGATLEAVVSRMKSIGSNVRFVALSATISNSEDIATWLGRTVTNQHVPAHREHFGEEFRPVKLQKFVHGYQSYGNDFAFDKMCTSKLSDIIAARGSKKPIMIFCCTRNSSVATAKELARLWSMSNAPARLWKGPNTLVEPHSADLKLTMASGVAFHHAGLDPGDRHLVETAFLQGQTSIICCTSTLAVGVNLPCHLVIIKGTAGWQDGGCKEYSDLEVMQMLGRAGRPQFDDSAIAVIMTRKERVGYYERLVSGSESLESCLHLNLIDHLNAEIGLGNITDVESAIRWLAGTFLFVRLRRNPTHYQLKEGANRDDEDEMLRQICGKDIKLLQEPGLVSEGRLHSTQFGDAMARYYVRFETMKNFLKLKRQASMSEIFSAICQAEEFREVRLKAGEKSLYKELNRGNGIRFPLKVDIALSSHKISLLLQSELGGVDFPDGEQFQKHKFAVQQDKGFAFSHVNRLIRCIIDCQICVEDAVSVRNSLELARSFAAKVWDSSPLQMKQIEQIGVVAVRKLAAAGITSIESLESREPHEIDMILSKNPPFGVKLLARLADFPKLRISLKIMGKDIKPGQPIKICFKAEIAFMNEKCPSYFQRRPVYVCFLAETSDGRMVDFRRISGSKLQNGHEVLLSAEMKTNDQHIICHVMCDDIAGTLRSAEIKPDLPILLFPSVTEPAESRHLQKQAGHPESDHSSQVKSGICRRIDSFNTDDLLFDDFFDIEKATDWTVSERCKKVQSGQKARSVVEVPPEGSEQNKVDNSLEVPGEGTRLDNGRWACNHKCKDKTTHLCCREGLDKPPRVSKKQLGGTKDVGERNQPTISASMGKKDRQIDELHETSGKNGSWKEKLSEGEQTSKGIGKGDGSRPEFVYDLDNPDKSAKGSSDYGDDSFSDFPSPSALLLGTQLVPQGPDQPKDRVSDTLKELFDLTDESTAYTWNIGCTTFTDRDVVNSSKTETRTTNDILAEHTPEGANNSAIAQNVDSQSDIWIVDSPPTPTSLGQKRKLPTVHGNVEFHNSGEKKHKVEQKENECNSVFEPHPFLQLSPAPIPKDWEDIDPALLNEFKDIVDFF
ncbi:Sec63 Brl domain-containing protein [Aspergillus ambiguus]|uniref:putative DEAD/DEAH box DNA helicase (Mer3) n=1 Tax=Aspergillus ambiguus TaxID=176160 RepID=UPI003CCD5A83